MYRALDLFKIEDFKIDKPPTQTTWKEDDDIVASTVLKWQHEHVIHHGIDCHQFRIDASLHEDFHLVSSYSFEI